MIARKGDRHEKTTLLLSLIATAANIAVAAEYDSFYGFRIDVPEHWIVLTRSELRENSDLFDFENADFGNIDKNLIKQVISKIQSGNIEIYLNQNTSDPSFTDNINIIKQAGKIPKAGKDLQKQCGELKTQLSRYFGRSIALYRCEITSVDNKSALVTEFDEAISGTTSMQYQFQHSPSILIIITATGKNETTDIIRKEFHQMVNTITFR